MQIVPVILAGGVGTRLWPLSREAYPKQFLKLMGQHTLLQDTLLRINKITAVQAPIVVTNNAYYFACLEQLSDIGIKNAHFILEPYGRNTAPAIALAAMHIQALYTEPTLMLVLPADHYIPDADAFMAAVSHAAELAAKNELLTFGIKPTAPKTGYGYIQVQEPVEEGAYVIKQFIEKPALAEAQALLEQGDVYWNSGMFMFSPALFLQELKIHVEAVFDASQQTYQASELKGDFLNINSKVFESCPSISIDYAVMEKTEKALVVPLDTLWNDLGCWASVAQSGQADEQNNVIHGPALAFDTTNCIIHSQGQFVATLGLKNHIIVSTPDAVLVADQSHAQQVKDLVAQLKLLDNELTLNHKKVYRPWGYYESLIKGEHFHVKRVMVAPGAQLSLQLHHHRAEHWVVVDGEATIVNGDKEFHLHANQSTYIPINTKHRLSNCSDKPLHVIEVQSGAYLEEDDIVRFEDVYGRVETV